MAVNSAIAENSAAPDSPIPPSSADSMLRFFRQRIPGRLSILLVCILALGLWSFLLGLSPSPQHALAYFFAILFGLSILAFPQLGVYFLAFLLIGQWPWNIIRYLGMLTVASTLVWLLIHHKRILPRNIILVLTGAFFLFVVASAIVPKTRIDLLSQVLAYAGNCSIVWLFITVIDSRARLLTVVRLMILSGVLTSIVGLIQWRTHFVWIASTTYRALSLNEKFSQGTTAFELQAWQGEFRIDSITGTPDYLPLYLQTLIPFVGLWLVRQRSWHRWLLGLSTILLFGICHLLSFTRGALLTTMLVLCMLGWNISRKRLILYAPLVMSLGLASMLCWAPLRDRLTSMVDLAAAFESTGNENSGAWRLRSIPVGIKLMFDRPFIGVGVGQGKWNWPESTFGTLIPDPDFVEPLPFHNDYLGVGIEMGLGGLAVLCLLLCTTIYRLQMLNRFFRLRSDGVLADISSASMIACVGLAAAMAIYPLVNEFRYLWLIFGLTGALIGLAHEPSSQESTANPST